MYQSYKPGEERHWPARLGSHSDIIRQEQLKRLLKSLDIHGLGAVQYSPLKPETLLSLDPRVVATQET